MMDWILQPWPWYVSGPLIGLTIPLLLFLSGRSLGISTSFQQIGAMCTPHTQLAYLTSYDKQDGLWRLMFVGGIVIGGFLGATVLSADTPTFLPPDYYSPLGLLKLALGGVLVGFGTRYAGGCTSGHTMMGLSNLQGSSLVATVSFFIGGLFMVYLIGGF